MRDERTGQRQTRGHTGRYRHGYRQYLEGALYKTAVIRHRPSSTQTKSRNADTRNTQTDTRTDIYTNTIIRTQVNADTNTNALKVTHPM